MNDDFFDIAELVSKYLMGDLTVTEQVYLDEWLSLAEENQEWFRLVTSDEFVVRKRQELKLIDVQGGGLFLGNEPESVSDICGLIS